MVILCVILLCFLAFSILFISLEVKWDNGCNKDKIIAVRTLAQASVTVSFLLVISVCIGVFCNAY